MSKRLTVEYERDEEGRVVRQLRREWDGGSVRHTTVTYEYDAEGYLIRTERLDKRNRRDHPRGPEA